MHQSRRKFITKSALGVGAISSLVQTSVAYAENSPIKPVDKSKRLPREVWVATLTQHYLKGSSVEEVIKNTVKTMESVAGYQPDIICLPEAFHVAGLPKELPPSQQTAEQPIGPITRPLAEFAKMHNCYVIAPIYTVENGKYYNAAVLIDRKGKLAGTYKKIRPTHGEITQLNLAPGPLDPPVFDTDFGKIGIQICFDIEWQDGWQKLQEKGADMVFWPSAFSAGKKINTMAWLNKYPVISSTRKGTTKICDITGEALAESGQYNLWGVCAPINLEKELIWSWPYANRFLDIHAKYGNRVRTYTLHEEEFSVLESRDPELKVAAIMKEFELLNYHQVKRMTELAQQPYWKTADKDKQEAYK